MTNKATWDDVKRRASVQGSPILTNWKAEREAARVSNEVTYSDSVMESFGISAGGTSVSAASSMQVSAVAACVAKISGAIVNMPIHEYSLDGGEIPARMPRSELWYLLNESPSPLYTAASMWEGVSMAQLLRGDSYGLIRRRLNGSFREILPLPWGSVSPVRTPGNGVRYYVNLPSHGITTWFDPSDILHFPGLGFDDETMRSMSVIQFGARNAIGNAIAMDEYSGKFFENGANPSIVLQSESKMSQQQITDMQVAFRNRYSGLANAHRNPLVLTQGVTAKELSLSADDAQLLEARKFQVGDIARAFGVPAHMIGESTGQTSWGTGLETNSRAFIQYTVQTWLKKIEQELNRKLYPRNTGRFLEFHRESLYESDVKAQADYFRAALGGPGAGDGWMSVDDVRRIKRMPPIEGGGEYYRAPRDPGKPADKPNPESTPAE
jgi:HK97 family phage portal protein